MREEAERINQIKRREKYLTRGAQTLAAVLGKIGGRKLIGIDRRWIERN